MKKLDSIVENAVLEFSKISSEKWEQKKSRDEWSRKEILGHLVDSSIYNLQRFTEIRFEQKPFPIYRYRQDELVIANDYQHADTTEIRSLWIALNKRISILMNQYSRDELTYTIQVSKDECQTLSWLINDYIRHLEHHLDQIRNYEV